MSPSLAVTRTSRLAISVSLVVTRVSRLAIFVSFVVTRPSRFAISPSLVVTRTSRSATASRAPWTWPTVAASLGAVPGARLVIWRRLPAEPTDTDPAESKVPERPGAEYPVCAPRSATEPAPRATEFAAVTEAELPSATPPVAPAPTLAPVPTAIAAPASAAVAASLPNAIASIVPAVAGRSSAPRPVIALPPIAIPPSVFSVKPSPAMLQSPGPTVTPSLLSTCKEIGAPIAALSSAPVRSSEKFAIWPRSGIPRRPLIAPSMSVSSGWFTSPITSVTSDLSSDMPVHRSTTGVSVSAWAGVAGIAPAATTAAMSPPLASILAFFMSSFSVSGGSCR